MVTCDKVSDPGTFQPSWVFNAIDVGEPVRVPQFSDKSYAVWGTWGGGKVRIEGSWDKSSPPDGGSWILLNDFDTTATCEVTANQIGLLLENPIWIRGRCVTAVTSVRLTINCTISAGAK